MKYSLRFLFILTTLVALGLGYLGHNVHVVRARRAILRQVEARGWLRNQPSIERGTTYLRRALGDEGIENISYPDGEDEELVRRFKQLYPETDAGPKSPPK